MFEKSFSAQAGQRSSEPSAEEIHFRIALGVLAQRAQLREGVQLRAVAEGVWNEPRADANGAHFADAFPLLLADGAIEAHPHDGHGFIVDLFFREQHFGAFCCDFGADFAIRGGVERDNSCEEDPVHLALRCVGGS